MFISRKFRIQKEGVIKAPLYLITPLDSDLLVLAGDPCQSHFQVRIWIRGSMNLQNHTLRAPMGNFQSRGPRITVLQANMPNGKSGSRSSNFERIKAHHDSIVSELMLDESVRIERKWAHLHFACVRLAVRDSGQRGNLSQSLPCKWVRRRKRTLKYPLITMIRRAPGISVQKHP